MKTRGMSVLIVSCALMLFAMRAAGAGDAAGQKVELKVSVKKEVRVVKNGQTTVQLQPVKDTKKGDVLVYTIDYRNSHDYAVKDVSIIDPVPAGTKYLEDAPAKVAKVSFSFDGGKTYHAAPVMQSVKNASGVTENKPVPPEKFTHVKWDITGAVPAGSGGAVIFKVKVQ